jgi:hypothetical protein
MKRCDHCGGRFGLVTHRVIVKLFCSRRCRTHYFVALAERFVSVQQWIGAVARSR